MKRIFCTMLILSVMIALLALPASAAIYEETITADFSEGFIYRTSDGISNVAFGVMDYLAIVGAATAVTIPSGSTGRVFAFVSCHGICATSASSNEIEDGIISCEALLNWNRATKSQHTAVTSGVNGSAWDYYFIDPNHDPNYTGT